eukprot:8223742-Alexandrium_andersonii.AAC.1
MHCCALARGKSPRGSRRRGRCHGSGLAGLRGLRHRPQAGTVCRRRRYSRLQRRAPRPPGGRGGGARGVR